MHQLQVVVIVFESVAVAMQKYMRFEETIINEK